MTDILFKKLENQENWELCQENWDLENWDQE